MLQRCSVWAEARVNFGTHNFSVLEKGFFEKIRQLLAVIIETYSVIEKENKESVFKGIIDIFEPVLRKIKRS